MNLTERLSYIMKLNELSASAFADKIGVQRSGISHILSGRNKPSLELIQKILHHFPKVSADWLISGQKVMDKPLSPPPDATPSIDTTIDDSNKSIKKIVVFYSDNTFEEYKN